jgi:hypothetical protein
MQRFNLRLTTEELKTLQTTLEHYLAESDVAGYERDYLRDVLTKIIVTQVEAETPFTYHKVDSETDLAF